MIRWEIEHKIDAKHFQEFMAALKDSFAINREGNPDRTEPRFLITAVGDVHTIRLERDMEDLPEGMAKWKEAGYPCWIEGIAEEHHRRVMKYITATETRMLKIFDIDAE